MKTFKVTRADLLGLIADNAEDEKLIRGLYNFTAGYLAKKKAPVAANEQGTREFVQPQNNTKG